MRRYVSGASVRCRERKAARARRSSSESASPASDLLADPAEAGEPERLVGELEPAEASAVPNALLERRVRLRDGAGEGEQEADGVLGGRDDRGLRRVRDDDPPSRGRREIDVVDADAGAPDDLEPFRPLDQVLGQVRAAADDDCVVVRDLLGEVPVRVDVDLELLPQELDAGFADPLPD